MEIKRKNVWRNALMLCAAAAVAVLVSSCRAPAPETGRYQWIIVPQPEHMPERIYVIDSDTGVAAKWSGNKWILADAQPDSIPDWNAIREARRKQVKYRAERKKQEEEARVKGEAFVKTLSQMPLEKQVDWAENICVCKFKGEQGLESYESLKGRYSSTGYRHPYKSTDDNLVVLFDAIVDGKNLNLGLSHTPIDSKGIFPAPATIIDDVKAEIKRQEEKQKEAHAENH